MFNAFIRLSRSALPVFCACLVGHSLVRGQQPFRLPCVVRCTDCWEKSRVKGVDVALAWFDLTAVCATNLTFSVLAMSNVASETPCSLECQSPKFSNYEERGCLNAAQR